MAASLDFLDYLIRDPGTDIIVSYLEGARDVRRFPEIGDRALAAGKPILMWKVGNTDEGQVAAASHTANLGGAMALYKSVFAQKGIIQIDDIQDMVDYGRMFRCGRLPAGNRIAMITVSGGAGILMTDECVSRGMKLAKLSPVTEAKLKEIVPSFGSIANPVDVTAGIFNDLALINRALTAIVEDPGVDCIALLNASLQGEIATKIAREIIAVAGTTDKPIACAWSARDVMAADAYALLDEARIPHYKSPVRCGRAFAAMSWYAEARRRNEARGNERPLVLQNNTQKQLLTGRVADIAEYEAKRVLAAYGIPVTQEELATSRDGALAIAQKIGFPVAIKVQSPDISHKTEARAVKLGIQSDAQLAAAYDEVLANAKAYNSEAKLEGVLVQEMLSGGIEAILGITNDPLFGPAVMFGLGGIFAEIMKDVSFRLAPVTPAMAREMIAEIKGYSLLTGARGQAHADVDALADAIVRLSALAVDLTDQVAELDINPLFVMEKGKGVKAVDALIRPKTR
jgi:acyl-CoA synthetase (NDP forming)